MAKVTYRGVSYDTAAPKATEQVVPVLNYRGIRYHKVSEVIK